MSLPKKNLTAADRLQIVTAVLDQGKSVTDTCRQWGISRSLFYQLKKKYLQAGPKKSDKLAALRPQRNWSRKGRRLKPEQVKPVIEVVLDHPDWGIVKIRRYLAEKYQKKIISRGGLQKLLERLNLNTRRQRQLFVSWARDFSLEEVVDLMVTGLKRDYQPDQPLTPEQRLQAIRLVEQEVPVSQTCQLFNQSRKTFYKWYERYQEADPGQAYQAVTDRKPEIDRYWRQASPAQVRAVLDLVVKHPEYSTKKLSAALAKKAGKPVLGNHGVQNVFRRHNLNTYEKRLAYAEAHQPSLVFQPVQVFLDKLKTVFGRLPQVSAIPPPKLLITRPFRNVKTVFRPFLIGLFVGCSSSLIVWQWLGMIARAPNLDTKLGLVFSSLALATGSFFFVYSLKYYFTVALVLSFSRQKPEEQEEMDISLSSPLINLLDKIFGVRITVKNQSAKQTNNGLNQGGLQPDLKHLKLERRPFISVHLPLYNEKRVVRRLLKACTTFEYVHPKTGEPNYEVIVADDSNDETRKIIDKFVDRHNQTHPYGPKIKVLRRETRQGFKGAALANALKHTDPEAEFIAVFDADFVPYPDSLELFLKYFAANGLDLKQKSWSLEPSQTEQSASLGSRLAVVGGYQWHVLNKSENWVTRGVRSEYAGSYVVERAGREILGLLKQISGSVYMIRRDVLEKVGWGTSITEDFQLTLKLYEQGYKVVYTPYIQAPAECVSTLKRLIRQRMRWAEGHSHNIRKMFKRLIFNPALSLGERLEFLYLSPYYLQAFFFMLGTLSWLIAEAVFKTRLPFWTSLWGWSLVFTNFFALPLVNSTGMFLEEAEEKDYLGIPVFIFLSYLLAPFQAYASLKGFLKKEEGTWFRTPKTGKITDVFKRGRFYRWISGILPGWRGSSLAGTIKKTLPQPTHAYLQRKTAHNYFNSFKIKPQRLRWLSRTLLIVLLLFSVNLLSLTGAVETIRVFPNQGAGRLKLTEEPKEENKISLKEPENQPKEKPPEVQVTNFQNGQSQKGFYLELPDDLLKSKQAKTYQGKTSNLSFINRLGRFFDKSVLAKNQSSLKLDQEEGIYVVDQKDGSQLTFSAKKIEGVSLTPYQVYQYPDRYEIKTKANQGIQKMVLRKTDFKIEVYGQKPGEEPVLQAVSQPIFEYFESSSEENSGSWHPYAVLSKGRLSSQEFTDYTLVRQEFNLLAQPDSQPVTAFLEFKLGYAEETGAINKLNFVLNDRQNLNRLSWQTQVFSHSKDQVLDLKESRDLREGRNQQLETLFKACLVSPPPNRQRLGGLNIDWTDFFKQELSLGQQDNYQKVCLAKTNSKDPLDLIKVQQSKKGNFNKVIFYPEGKKGPLVIDPTLSLTTSSSSIQVDVENRYRAIMNTGDTDDYLLIYDRGENDSSPDNTFEIIGPYIQEEGEDYALRDDGDRQTTVIESNDVRVRIKVEGRFGKEGASGWLQDSGSDDDIEVTEVYTFTTEGFFVEQTTNFKDEGIALDNTSKEDGYNWLMLDGDVTDAAFGGTIYYGNGETESSTSTDATFEDNNNYVVYPGAGSYQSAIISASQAGWFDMTGGTDDWSFNADREAGRSPIQPVASVDISPDTTGSWQEVSLTSYIPSGAEGICYESYNTSGTEYDFGIRHGDSTDSREGTQEDTGHQFGCVGVDTDRNVDIYIGNSTVHVILKGYVPDGYGEFKTNAVDKSTSTTGTWEDVDVSGDFSGGTCAVAFYEVDNTNAPTGSSYRFGARINGRSNDNRPDTYAADFRTGMMGLDSNEIFEQRIQIALIDLYVHGCLYSDNGVNVVTSQDPIDYSTDTTGSYQDTTITDAQTDGATGIFFGLYSSDNDGTSADERKHAIRRNGSSDDFYSYADVSVDRNGWVACDGNQVIEQRVENTTRDLYVWGWTYPDSNDTVDEDRIHVRERGTTPVGVRYTNWEFLLVDNSNLDSETERESYASDYNNPDVLSFTTGNQWSFEDDPDLEGLWYMEEAGDATRQDSSTRGNDLTESTDDTIVQSSEARQGSYSADFEAGDSEYLSISDGSQTGLDVGDELTIAFWAKQESYQSSGLPAIVSKSGATSQFGYYVQLRQDDLEFALSSNGNSFTSLATNGDDTANGSWHHIVVTYDGADIRAFINGSETSSGSFPGTHSGSINDSTADFEIGTYSGYDASPEYFDGLLDEVAVFSRALTATEIVNIYQQGIIHHYNDAEGAYEVEASGSHIELDMDGASNASTLLDGAVSVGETTITVDSTTGFDSPGTAFINGDRFTYTGTTSTTFTGVPNSGGNSVSAHVDNSVVVQANRHRPMWKVRNYRLNNKPPSVTMEGASLSEGTDYNVDYKPVSDAYFADELTWYSTLESETAAESPDVGSGDSSASNTSNGYTAGKYGKALDLDGSDDYLYFPAADNIDISGDSAGVIEFWIQPDWGSDTTSTSSIATGNYNSTSGDAFTFGFCGNDAACASSGAGTAGDLFFKTFDSYPTTQSGVTISSADYSWEAGEWIHVRLEWDDTLDSDDEMHIYLNGVEPSHSHTNGGSLDVSALSLLSNWYVGDQAASTVPFDGKIDEFRVYTPESGGVDKLAAGGDTSDSDEYLFDESSDYTLDLDTVDANNRGEYLFLGSDTTVSGFNVDLDTNGATSGTLNLDWEYWDGSSWSSLESISGFNDGTSNLTQDGAVAWDETPTNWTPYSVNASTDLYFIRASLNNSSGEYSTDPVENFVKSDVIFIQYLDDLTSADQTLVVVPENLWLFLPTLPFVLKLIKKWREKDKKSKNKER